jgi:hypothetical protein
VKDETDENSGSSEAQKASVNITGEYAIANSETDRYLDYSNDRSSSFFVRMNKTQLKSEQEVRPAAILNTLTINSLTPEEYEFVRNSLEDFKNEIGHEIRMSRALLGSAIAASVGLSAGYVVWLIKGGSLLASVLSSIPAWQIADPLAILAGKKEKAENDDDDESLENIVEDQPDRQTDRKNRGSKDVKDDHGKTA